MSRKSLSKKEKEITYWYKCEKCLISITSINKEAHNNFCMKSDTENYNSYIKDNIIYSNAVGLISNDFSNFKLSELKYLVFVTETALKLCSLKIGEYVKISSINNTFIPFVRKVWPVPDECTEIISLNFEECDGLLEKMKDTKILLTKLMKDILIAHEISLSVINSKFAITPESESCINMLIKKLSYNNVYCVNNIITVNFLNQYLNFNIDSVTTKFDLDIENKFANLNLSNKSEHKFYLVKERTKFKINSSKKFKNKDEPKSSKGIALGFEKIINEINEVMNIALGYTKTSNLSTKNTRGVLIHGSSGCGKSLLCEIITAESNAHVINVNTSEIFSKFYGESEANLTNYFENAFSNYPSPTLIVMDEIKNICPNLKSNNTDAVKRISSVFCNLMDSLHIKEEGKHIFVITTTDNPDDLNSSIRRSGRLDFEIEIPVPDPNIRELILKQFFTKIEHNLTLDDIKNIAKVTHGFVGSDLISLLNKSFLNALQRTSNIISLCDINVALTHIKPSAMREVLIENPNIKWTDIGGLDDLKLKLKQAIDWPINHPEIFQRLNIRPPRGILMFGPPGCSKTLIAKALATESNLNFLSIKGPELFSMWVGESEKAVRELFRKARQVAPSIIFFDEIDAIGSERNTDGGGSSVKERVLAQMLTEIDGVNSLNNVIIVAATNRPDLIDRALLRPGRIDRIIYVKLPDNNTRLEIFKINLKKIPTSHDINIDELITKTNGYSGAEIKAICQEAALKGLEENLNISEIKKEHFDYALTIVKPRTSKELLDLYDNYLLQF